MVKVLGEETTANGVVEGVKFCGGGEKRETSGGDREKRIGGETYVGRWF